MCTLDKNQLDIERVRQSYLELHIAVLFWGFSAILGDLIQLSWFMITIWRVLLASVSLFLLMRLSRISWSISKKDIFKFSIVGLVIAMHWLTFFGSVKLANASVALVTYSTVSFLLSILEPILLPSKFSLMELGLGLLIIPAMILIVHNLDTTMHLGFYMGLLSAFLAALFGILNKKWISHADPMVITTVEMISATLFLCILLPVWLVWNPEDILFPGGLDWWYLAVLVLGCTTLAFYICVRSLRYVSVFAQSMVMNLEPVYGIIFAIFILGDNKELHLQFYIGVCIILLTVFLHPILKQKFSEVSDRSDA